MGDIVKFERCVNGVRIEQRCRDGFVNGTAMCLAYDKRLNPWFRNQDTWDLFVALAQELGAEIKCENSRISDSSRLSASKYAKFFPGILFVKQGSPVNGGGVWLHPFLAPHVAQWCDKIFAIQVSRWIYEWFATGNNPVQPSLDQQIEAWQQRYDFRVRLKDILRVELMDAVVDWAERHGKSPISLCSKVHDLMNERVQGARSQQISSLGRLPLGVLIRDYFAADQLVIYSSINTLTKNAIVDRGLDPISAVNDACDSFLGKKYRPRLAEICENVHLEGKRLLSAKKTRQLEQGIQLNLFDSNQAV